MKKRPVQGIFVWDVDQHVDLAHIKLEEVGTAQLGNEDLLYNAKAAAFSPGSGLFVPKKAGSRNFTNILQKLYGKIVPEKIFRR